MIADAKERERALDPTRSFIVQAPAGSGKTTLLVSRFLKLLSSTKKPEEVLAITFTRKAAAEMRKRVLENLPNAADIAHRLRIETIDAFCLSLARQLPVPSQFGVAPGIAGDPEPLYREAAWRAASAFDNPAVARLLAHLDNNVGTAVDLLAGMLRKRDQWLRKTGLAPTRQELEASFASERTRLLDRARELDSRASEEFAESVLTKKGEWRKRSREAQALSSNEPLRQALAALLELPPEKYSEPQWEALEAMLALLPLAAAELKLVFAARGEADFTEVAQGAVRALGSVDDPSDLLLKLDSKISHILVDEFQDTSISQWELLERLTAGWDGSGNPDGDGRTLFVVGDPMQSIYRFREAEVGLFLLARREGLPNVKLEPIALRTNFRSQAALVGFFNEAFGKIFPKQEAETSGAVPYSPASPNDPALPGEAVTWHVCPDSVFESRKIMEIIRENSGSCALLVRTRASLADIVPALKAAGIRFRAIEIDKLGEKQVVQDLFALTRALTHLADRVAWLAILRAPWVGLSLSDFSKYFENKSETVWELIRNVPSLDRFRAVLAPALANRLRGTLRDRVESTWLALGGPACIADAGELEDAEVYLDALEKLEEAGEVDFARLAELLEELYAPPDPAATESDLQIMTIHKAKGLEFGTVILPGLHRPPGKGDAPLMRWKELPDRSLLLAPIKETGGDAEPAYEYLKRLDREAEDTEAARLLYVAATRAEHRLHLLACPKKTMPPKRSLLACAWPVAEPVFEGIEAPETNSSESNSQPAAPFILKRLPAGWTPPAAPPAAAWTAPPEGRREEQIEFSWASETARHVGTVVHRWLQAMAEAGLKGWDAKRVESLRPAIERDLRSRGVQSAGPAAELVAAALKNAIGDERGRWLLGPHPVASNEYRLRSRGRSFRIDRYIEDAKGAKWVVDYKTGEHRGGSVDAFLDSERERYKAQLDEYAKAMKGARPALYFPLLKGWREW
ncbi:MAG TPA: UvrD-helicase domain-containing protein [Burkholderiales bacterium]|nr:UvrD-helicase domain-containing protein [Burkholderiales bacterium]